MGSDNISKFIFLSGKYISNIKFKILANFVCTDYQDFIIMTNKVASQSDLNTIENYIKNVNIIKSENIMSPYLFKSKSYLKMIDISYIMEGTNIPINSSIIESIIQSTYIFNDMCLAVKPHVIKALPKSDMVIIWIDIWDT